MRKISLAPLLLVAGLAAQESKPMDLASVRIQLASNTPKEVAWGAHHARESKFRELIPDLCKALGRMGESKQLYRIHAALAICDALVGLDAEVGAEELAVFEGSTFRVVTMILMGRSPKKHEARLTRIFARFNDETWLAAGHFLTSIRSKAFVPELLAKLRCHSSIVLREKGQVLTDFVGLGGGTGGGFGRRLSFAVPMDFPPVPYYYFHTHLVKNGGVVARGKTSVFYRRQLNSRRRYFLKDPAIRESTSQRLAWIATLLKAKVEHLPFKQYSDSEIIWKDVDHYERKISVEKRKLTGMFDSLVQRLIQAKLCTAEAVSDAVPLLSIGVNDRRWQSRRIHLPEIEQVGLHTSPCKPKEQAKK